MTQLYELANGDRKVRFRGTLLAHVSTQAPDQHRWQELNLYKTDGGKYVLQKVGVSTVYHTQDHSFPGNQRRNGLRLLTDNPGIAALLHPCTVCKPLQLQNAGWIALEVNRNTVHVSETPEGIISSAHQRDDEGSVFLSKIAERLLEVASRKDPSLYERFMVEDLDNAS